MSPAGESFAHRAFVARPFSSLTVGEELWGALTVTEGHVLAAASIFNDPGPNHVNALHAEHGRFGARIAHGPLVVGIAIGVLGNAIGATIVALLEQSSRFLQPTYLGDTVVARWSVTEATAKEAFGGGVVGFEGEVLNQGAERLVEATATLAIGEEPPWKPLDLAAEISREGQTSS
jgi:3-hydroxybutyryl-CoA dehydratase